MSTLLQLQNELAALKVKVGEGYWDAIYQELSDFNQKAKIHALKLQSETEKHIESAHGALQNELKVIYSYIVNISDEVEKIRKSQKVFFAKYSSTNRIVEKLIHCAYNVFWFLSGVCMVYGLVHFSKYTLHA